MPGFCTPWPGNSNAIGPVSFTPMSYPGHQTRPPGQPRAEAGQQDMVSTLDASLSDRFLQCQRNRSAGRVAIFVDVDRHSVQRQADAPGRGVNDAEVRLVWHPQVDVLERYARGAADLVRLADEDVDRELEDVRADHVDVRGCILGRIRSLVDVAARDLRVTAAVGPEAPALEAATGRSRADHRRVCTLGGDVSVRDREAVDEAGARRQRVPGHSTRGAELVLDSAGHGRKWTVGRRGADEDNVEVCRRDARGVKRAARRFRRDLKCRGTRLRDVPLVDASALGDPLVRGIHHLFEVEVRDYLLRRVGAHPGDGAGAALGFERAQRDGVGTRPVLVGDRHFLYASSRSAVFCSRNFHRSLMTFIFSSSSSDSSTSYLSSIAAMSSTRSSESAARSRWKLLSSCTSSGSMPRISAARLWSSLKSRWHSGSGSSRLIVGGSKPRSSARMQAAASMAPAAPSRCPWTDFVELTASSYAWSPNTALIAFVSATSPSLVEVPCAFT